MPFALGSKHSLLGKALNNAYGQRTFFCNYLKHPELAPSNQLTKNTISPFVIGHKNFLFAGHPNDTQALDMYYSLIETAKANNVRLLNYLAYVFSHINNTTGYSNGAISFTSVHITDPDGNPQSLIRSGAPLCVHFTYKARQSVEHVTFGIMMRDRFDQEVFGTNGALLHTLKDVEGEGHGCFTFPAMNLGQGTYTVNLAAHQGTTHLETCYHWWDRASSFEVLQDTNYIFSGHTRLEAHLDV